jgi:hypothetical protein
MTMTAHSPTSLDVGVVLIRAASHARVSPRMRVLLHGRYCQAILRNLGIADRSRGLTEDARLLETATATTPAFGSSPRGAPPADAPSRRQGQGGARQVAFRVISSIASANQPMPFLANFSTAVGSGSENRMRSTSTQ